MVSRDDIRQDELSARTLKARTSGLLSKGIHLPPKAFSVSAGLAGCSGIVEVLLQVTVESVGRRCRNSASSVMQNLILSIERITP